MKVQCKLISEQVYEGDVSSNTSLTDRSINVTFLISAQFALTGLHQIEIQTKQN